MVIKILVCDGLKVRIDTKTDDVLYSAPANPPGTGTRYTSGIDLYTHVSKKGNRYFYTHEWSMWQGTVDCYEIISREAAIDFLLEKAGLAGYEGLTEDDLITISEILGEDIFAETG